MFDELKAEIDLLQNPQKAKIYQRFFKTGKGEYGEGDIFFGLTVPQERVLVKKYWDQVSLSDIKKLLISPVHEYRSIALMILVEKFERDNEKEKEQIVQFYLELTPYINNWDLVDMSAHHILGEYLRNREKNILYELVKSDSVWERRIAIIATYQFIRNNQFEDTLKIAEILITDKHDLIHKAVGWMLRELGKRNQVLERQFLDKYAAVMPRTMLCYAIEKFDPTLRKHYLEMK